MPFNAGELVATLRADLTQFSRDLGSARSDLGKTGSAADDLGRRTEQAGTRAAAGSRKAADAAKVQQAAATQAGAATAAAAAQAEGATRAQLRAAIEAGKAQEAAGRAGESAEQKVARAAREAEEALRRQQDATRTLGVGLTAYGAAAAGAFVLAVKAQADFGSRMAQLQSLSHANAADMERERQAALSLGTAYGYSANQVADAEIELQKAGQSVQDQLNGGLSGALTLAAAGQLDVADATSIAVTTLTQFRLGADKTSHVADLLAAGSDKALGSVGDLGMALKQGGLVASQMGVSVEDTVGTLSAFAQAGLIGSDAGTSFKTMLLSLQSPSSQAQKYLDRYNISAYDAQGRFVGMANLAEQLKTHLGNLSQQQRDAALSTIFGTDAIRSANVLYQEGAKGIQQWSHDVNDAGFAAEQARGKQNSLAGDLQKLSAVVQTDLIKAGAALEPVLRPIAQTLTAVADVAGDIPAPILGTATALAGLTGAAALGAGALILFLPKFLDFQRAARIVARGDVPVLSKSVRGLGSAFSTARGAGGKLAGFLGGPFGIALTAATALVVALEERQQALETASSGTTNALTTTASAADVYRQAAEDASKSSNWLADLWDKATAPAGTLADPLKQTTDDIEKEASTIQGALKGLQSPDLWSWLSQFSPEKAAQLGPWKDQFTKLDASLEELAGQSGPQAAAAFEKLTGPLNGNKVAISELLDQFPKYRAALVDLATQQGINVTQGTHAEQNERLLAIAHKQAGTAAQDAATGTEANARAIAEIQGSASGATQSVSDLANAIKGLGSTQLDADQAAIAFEQAVDDATSALKDNGKGLDISTEAGRANKKALDGIASAAIQSAAAITANGGSADDAAHAVERGRAAFVKAATAMTGSKKRANELADALHLIPADVKSLVSVPGLNPAIAHMADLQAALEKLDRSSANPKITADIGPIHEAIRVAQQEIDGLDYYGHKVHLTGGPIVGHATGGRVPGVDHGDDRVFSNVYRPGEHVLTVDDVSAMGGHNAVYAFRRNLHGFADGGQIGAADAASARAEAASGRRLRQIEAQKARVLAIRRQARDAEKQVQKAQDASNKIYGPKTGPKKHEAVQRTRRLQKAADALEKRQKAAEDRLAKLRDARSNADSRAEAQATRATDLRQTAQDLSIARSRGEYVDASQPFGATDLAFQEAGDTNLSKAARARLNALGKSSNARMLDLNKAATSAADGVTKASDSLDKAKDRADAAKSSLDSVRDAFASVRDGIASTVRSVFSLGSTIKDPTTTEGGATTTSRTHNAGTAAAWDEEIVRVAKGTSTAGGTSVRSIRSALSKSNSTATKFAKQVQQLVSKGYSSAVVQDVAELGVEQGSEVAAALLLGSKSDVSAINYGYRSIATAGQKAGTTVAKQQYGSELDAATAAARAADRQVDLAQRSLDQAEAHEKRTEHAIESAQRAVVDAVQGALGGTKHRAAGGLHEPQIARAGANILWAEDSTSGEAYIPFAADRRRRALGILDETARRMGRQVVPVGTRAQGGISGGTTYGGDSYDLRGAVFGSNPREAVLAMSTERRKRIMRNELRRLHP